MKFAHFFIQRPIFASVISIVIVLLGIVSVTQLPVDSYPDVVPPTIIVRCIYPGADADTAAKTVAMPLEEEINGVEDMLYMSAACSSDGMVMISVTFKVGTDIDMAQVRVQNRVNLALPRLPEAVRRIGVDVRQRSPSLTLIVNLISPDGSYTPDELYNYARIYLKDELSRIPGVGEVMIFGTRDYTMRIWIDPVKAASCGLTASDIVAAIREQNIEVAAGGFGFEPSVKGTLFQVPAITRGRLITPEEFGMIVVKTDPTGRITYLRDVARIELGAQQYGIDTYVDGQPSTAIGLMKRPGANAIETAEAIRAAMKELAKRFPPGISYQIYFDTTEYIRESIQRVIHTLLEAFVLVAIVIILFLQTWRASLIPLIAVPVSLIGTFTAMHAFGFTINNLTMFGLVLAIGIVVDDAIVVVENVERHMRNGLSPLEASFKAMEEVTTAVIAIGLVLAAVFIPTAFIPGLEGRFYRQFALTIAISTLISALVSVTLTPALCALLLKPHQQPRGFLGLLIHNTIGRFLRGFDKLFEWTRDRLYLNSLKLVIRHGVIVLFIYLGLVGMMYLEYKIVPRGFIPEQDQGYIFAYVQLPDGASVQRTKQVAERIRQIMLNEPGVAHVIEIQGFSLLQFGAAGNAASFFVRLAPFAERIPKGLTAQVVVQSLQMKLLQIQEGVAAVFNAPPIQGLGTTGGVRLQIQDRAGYGYQALQTASLQMMGAAMQLPGVISAITTFRANVPQVYLEIDREKAKKMGLPLTYVWDTLSTYLASTYVNDFTLYGRPFQVRAQVDAPFRMNPEQLLTMKLRNPYSGQMVPLGSIVKIQPTNAPVVITHYNVYPAADLTVTLSPFISTGLAMEMLERLAQQLLPPGMTIEWTDVAYLQKLAGNIGVYILPFCVLLVFLILAALYESWSLPFAIILIVPLCVLFALSAIFIRGISNNLFVQIGFVVLIGLAAKNAILVVEFARQLQQQRGMNRFQAALEAARLRLRPILMTSLAFSMDAVPLMLSRGAGREMHQAVGTSVFWGMLGVTLFGIFMTPVFYVLIRRLVGEKSRWSDYGKESGRGKTFIMSLFLLGFLGVVISGCTLGPNYTTPQPSYVEEEFKNIDREIYSTDSVEVEWWRVFKDEKLIELVSFAVENNHDIKIISERVYQARAMYRLSKFDLYPTVHASGGYIDSLSSVSRAPYPREKREIELYDAGFDMSWELDIWGRVRRSVESAKAQVEAINEYKRAVIVTVIAEVARNYLELRGLQEQLAVAKDNIKNLEETVKLVKSRLDAGMARELDLARVNSQLEATRATVPQIENAIKAAIHRISILVGKPPTELEHELSTPAPLPIVREAIKIGDPATWLRRRADIRAAEREVAAATAKIGVAKADLFPRVVFIGTIGLEAGEFSDLFRAGADTYSFGPRISWAAFDIGRVIAKIDVAKSQAREALLKYEKTLLQALEETETALVAYGQQRQHVHYLETALREAKYAYELALHQYKAGIVDFTTVLDTERSMLNLRSQLTQARTLLAITTVSVYKALGGGWEIEKGLNISKVN